MALVQLFCGTNSLLDIAVRRSDDRSFIGFMESWPTTPGLGKPGLRSTGQIWGLSTPRTCTLRARNHETRDGSQPLDPIPPQAFARLGLAISSTATLEASHPSSVPSVQHGALVAFA